MQKDWTGYGFRLDQVSPAGDIDGQIYQFTHLKSGGQVVWLKTDDDNRTFGIGFLTPPEDSTGVAHIVEHAVLSGSRKYPAKDPFMQMLKRSMSTFLNAMTFADMTIYPVASMNERDFHNLMDVYLDATLFPRIYEEERIFKQEGWHLELFDKDVAMTYNGVVYNEMRGAYSTPDRTVYQQVTQNFHPESTYAHESGGYPYDIPKLTYQDFLDFHRCHYRPENALTYLYGNIDIDRALAQIDGDFFAEFTASGRGKSQIMMPNNQAGFKRDTVYYDGDQDMTAETDSYLSYVVNMGQSKAIEAQFINSLVSDVLINAESSPLRQALVDAGYGADISAISGDGCYQNFGLILEKADVSQTEQILKIIEDELAKQADQGVNKDLVHAIMNANELQIRRAGGANRGVSLFIQVMTKWRYGMDIEQSLNYGPIFKAVRAAIDNNLIEDIIRKKILPATSKQFLVHQPQSGIFSQLDQELASDLANQQTTMSDQEVADLIAANEDLRSYQMAGDSPENLATLPSLTLDEVDRQTKPIDQDINQAAYTSCFHAFDSNGIDYLDFYFPVDEISSDQIPYLQDWVYLLGSVATKKYSFQELDIELMKLTAGLDLTPRIYRPSQADYCLQLDVSFASLANYTSQALALIQEIIMASDFSNRDRVKTILQRLKNDLEGSFENNGHRFAMRRLRSFTSQADYLDDQLHGLGYYDHLKSGLADFDAYYEKMLAHFADFQTKIWNKDRVTIALTADRDRQSDLIGLTHQFVDGLSSHQVQTQVLNLPLSPGRKEAITSNSNVQYVSMGGLLPADSYDYAGYDLVLANILSKDYLYEQIRAQGGAYGAGLSLTRTGDLATYSYRDPNIDRTIAVYQNIGQELTGLALSQAEIDQYIIGSMTSFHGPLAAEGVNRLMMARYFNGTTKADVDRRLQEALDTQIDQLRDRAPLFDQVLNDQASLVVFGNQEAINQAQVDFDQVRSLR